MHSRVNVLSSITPMEITELIVASAAPMRAGPRLIVAADAGANVALPFSAPILQRVTASEVLRSVFHLGEDFTASLNANPLL